MGSVATNSKRERGGRPPGKIDASLEEKLKSVQWGEYKISDLFESENGDFDIQRKHINGKGEYVITAGLTDSGILGKSDIQAKIFRENTITIDMFGNAFFRPYQYKLVTHARVFSLMPTFKMTPNIGLFIANAFHFLYQLFGYENMCLWNKIKDISVQLPIGKNGKIDFDFMEAFVAELEAQRVAELEAQRVAELEAYLTVTGLNDYVLTEEEELSIEHLEKVQWKDYQFKEVFDKIKQGRRLKTADQISGDIPFVMSGVTNTGVANYISNPINHFPSNSITIDIFGNTFYRNYAFSAGDDTGIYWSEKREYSQNQMLFLASAAERALFGKYSYGNKLRSSQSKKLLMKLPTSNEKIDFIYMETLISAIKKLVIKDVILWADKRIAATKEVVNG